MSISSPVIDYLDVPNKLIYLREGVREYHPVTDIYVEIRYIRRTNELMRSFDLPVSAAGNIPKGGGRFTPRYAIFNNGWRVVPDNVSHTLSVTGEQLTDTDGGGPDVIAFDYLSPGVSIKVSYEPPSAEIIVVNTSGGAVNTWTEAEKRQIRAALGITGDRTSIDGGVISEIAANTESTDAKVNSF